MHESTREFAAALALIYRRGLVHAAGCTSTKMTRILLSNIEADVLDALAVHCKHNAAVKAISVTKMIQRRTNRIQRSVEDMDFHEIAKAKRQWQLRLRRHIARGLRDKSNENEQRRAQMRVNSQKAADKARNKRKTQAEVANAVQSLPAHSRLRAGVSRRELHEQMAMIKEVHLGRMKKNRLEARRSKAPVVVPFHPRHADVIRSQRETTPLWFELATSTDRSTIDRY